MKNIKIIGCLGLIIFVLSCSSSKKEVTKENIISEAQYVEAPGQPQLGGKRAMPFAYIYKTNGNYDDRVTAVYNQEEGKFISFPAPTDVSVDNEPLHVADGWLLDRRGGIGQETVFLKWTYNEYSKLKEVPTLDELRAAIIPDAKVTEIIRLDMTTFAAQRDTSAVNNYIRELNVTQ